MHRLPLLLVVACRSDADPIPDLPPDAPTRCIGHWFHDTDGVPDARGFEVHDAEGRTIESASGPIGSGWATHIWQTWETDASGTDRLSEVRSDLDGDDVPDLVAVYAHVLDERLRLASTTTREEGAPVRVDGYTYDDLDQLVVRASTVDGAPAGSTRHEWAEGRLVTTESFASGGQLLVRVGREYLAPAPSLDRIETWSQSGTDTVGRFDCDDDGRVLAHWRVEDAVERLVLTQVWDDADHVIDAVEAWPTGGLWGDAIGETRTTRIYDDDGRLRTVSAEDDALADGTFEQVERTEWSWTCE